MRLYVAATGSAANTYILSGIHGESLILDAGASIKSVLPAIEDVRQVRGVLVTHEHADHCRHWQEYGKRGIRVFGSLGTLEELNPKGPLDMCSLACKRAMVPLVDVVNLGGFSVMAFPVQHDAREPTGFLIRYRPTGEQIVYATDTYYLKYTFPGTTYWIMECNYCEDLIEGETNEVLRQRLRESHMSLRRLQGVFRANDMSVAAKVVLVHLSDKRSDEVRMLEGIADATLMKAGEEIVAAHNGDLIELAKTPF